MSVMASRPLLRWAVPTGVAAVVISAGALGGTLHASADVTLPERGVNQLLADLATARVSGVSGHVTEHAALGLPSLPTGADGDASSQLDSLVAGSHSLRVWYSGPDEVRVALLGVLGESDLIRDGSDVWIWSSRDNAATHVTLPAAPDADHRPHPAPSLLPLTPGQAAQQILDVLDTSTRLGTEASDLVADRPAYELVAQPRDDRSLVAKVRIAIDGTEHIPTRVQVFAKGHPASPAFEIGFDQISFSRPDPAVFSFTPPAGATITQADPSLGLRGLDAAAPGIDIIGSGWTSVLVARMPQQDGATGPATPGGTPEPDPTPGDALHGRWDALLSSLPEVHGSWGSGRLMQSRLFSILITDDGRVLAGAVDGGLLQQAAADPAAAPR